MASHSIDRIAAGEGVTASGSSEFLQLRRMCPLEVEEPYTANDFGAIRGFVFTLLFEGIFVVICVALFAWVF